MIKDFEFAHLVPPPYRAFVDVCLIDGQYQKVLRIDRLGSNKKQYATDCVWNLKDASEKDAQLVIDGLISTLRRHMIGEMTWLGQPLDTAEQQAEALLGVLDTVKSWRDANERWQDMYYAQRAVHRQQVEKARFRFNMAIGFAVGALISSALGPWLLGFWAS